MEKINSFISYLGNLVGVISSILGLWTFIRSPEEVKATLVSWSENLQSRLKIKSPKQTVKSPTKKSFSSEEDFSEFLENLSDKSNSKPRPQNRIMTLLYTLAILTILTIILSSIGSRPASPPANDIVSPPIEWTMSGGMNIVSLLWMYVCLFSVIGAMRGWAKELLVVFSGILALAVNFLSFKYFPFLRDLSADNISAFWVRSIITIILVYFGYHTVIIIPRFTMRSARERLSDTLSGAAIGGINGYLITGSILAYFHMADYPYKNIIAPATDANFQSIVNNMMAYMPPNLLGEPGIYFAVLLGLIFVLVVYV